MERVEDFKVALEQFLHGMIKKQKTVKAIFRSIGIHYIHLIHSLVWGSASSSKLGRNIKTFF